MIPDDDYYLVLGVSRLASPAAIRARYRDLARTLHPDVAGAQSTAAFQKIAGAYAVLADPVARRRHDAALARSQARPAVRETRSPGAAWRREAVSRRAELMDVEWPQALAVEVILTPDEAARGVEVPIAVPRAEPCHECAGTGGVWLFECGLCGGQRVVLTEEIVGVRIPPLRRPSAILEVVLHGLGIPSFSLRLHARIG
jgi:molecular chaperone DnaJ